VKPISEDNLFPYRPIPFYFITTTDPKELTYEKFYDNLSDMKKKGFGGVIPFNRPPHGFTKKQYFTEFWFETIGNCLRACRDLGLRVWLQDDFKAPSGSMGGRLEEIAPDLKPLRLVMKDDCVVTEEVPWGFPAFEDPESAELFQKHVYETYKKQFGKYFGTTIIGFFSDADSRRVNSEVYTTDSPMKDYFPWSKNFAASFKSVYGYDIVPHLSGILRREVSWASRDYWEHSGNLYFSWFASNYEWCKKNGLEYTFHTSDSAPFRLETTYFNSAFAEGKAIDAGRNCDFPGTDHECLDLNGGRLFLRECREQPLYVFGEENPTCRVSNFFDVYADLRAKQAQSCAYLYDKKGCMCEMFAATGWNAEYRDLRSIASWQIMQGISFIVLHAYHYRLHGVSKNFAPPSFCTKSYLDFSIKQFNDSLAEDVYLASRGSLKVDLALLDPTDSIWEGSGDSKVYLALAKRLNHFPQGYIVSDMKGLRRKAADLKAVINPGINLTEAERTEIASLGLILFEAEEITVPEKLEAILPTGIRWEGDGDVMFMRRTLDNDEELLLVANIESENTLTGHLKVHGKVYDVELAQGEIASFGVGFERYRNPTEATQKQYLPEVASVRFEKKNSVPMLRWEDESGRAFSLLSPELREHYFVKQGWYPPFFEAKNVPPSENPLFRFAAKDSLFDLELLISERFLKENPTGVLLDGKPVKQSGKTFVLDDAYNVYTFDVTAGEHVLSIQLKNPVTVTDLLYLQGDFDVNVKISGEPLYQANAATRLAEGTVLALCARRGVLAVGESWTNQGQPFYSGEVDYNFSVTVPENLADATLVIPKLGHAAKVYVDGILQGEAACPPYRVPLSIDGGVHEICIRTINTFGNVLLCQRQPSGLLAVPYLEK